MSGPSYRVTRDFYSLRIYINDALHLWLPSRQLRGVDSWIDGPSYCIEYTLDMGKVLTEYDDKEKWRLILAGLDGVLK